MNIIFGGSFNPPHKGHEKIIDYTLKKFSPEKIIIIPAFSPPHKDYTDIIDFGKRYEWLKKIFNSENTEVSDIESKFPCPSYSVNTVNYLKNYYDDLHMLIGSDSLYSFKSWYKWEELLKNIKLIVYPRNPYKNIKSDIPHITLNTETYNISSSDIRKAVINNDYNFLKNNLNPLIYNEIIEFYKK
ncbi:MAG TPA: nicotinate (nicotinamide) nucleotide adenylyltransferase [Tepiditoga sp.]|nr:nicotinate (nicotinamide) nucleotide adenylyltransferase [Tepiditoga sp.]